MASVASDLLTILLGGMAKMTERTLTGVACQTGPMSVLDSVLATP